MEPTLRTRLAQLRRVLDDPAAGRTQLKLALDQSDAILVEMKSVLDKMLELETFNEVVDTLRSIIAEQEKLNQETLRQQGVARVYTPGQAMLTQIIGDIIELVAARRGRAAGAA